MQPWLVGREVSLPLAIHTSCGRNAYHQSQEKSMNYFSIVVIKQHDWKWLMEKKFHFGLWVQRERHNNSEGRKLEHIFYLQLEADRVCILNMGAHGRHFLFKPPQYASEKKKKD